MESFTIAERLHLLQILPVSGNAVTLRCLADFKKELSFSDSELTEYEIRVEHAGQQEFTRWNPEKAKAKEIEINPARLNQIQAALRKLDEEQVLTETLMPLYERFMEMKVSEVVTK